MGSVALITLLYRICSKPAISVNRHPHAATTGRTPSPTNGASPTDPTSNPFRRLSQRFSMTSMQARILSRLRDQPPKYESPHIYDARVRQEQQQTEHELQQHQQQQPQIDGAVDTTCEAIATIDGVMLSAAADDQRRPSSRPSLRAFATAIGSAPPCYDNEAYSVCGKETCGKIHRCWHYFEKCFVPTNPAE